jgi:hypothetical protein
MRAGNGRIAAAREFVLMDAELRHEFLQQAVTRRDCSQGLAHGFSFLRARLSGDGGGWRSQRRAPSPQGKRSRPWPLLTMLCLPVQSRFNRPSRFPGDISKASSRAAAADSSIYSYHALDGHKAFDWAIVGKNLCIIAANSVDHLMLIKSRKTKRVNRNGELATMAIKSPP